MSQLEINPQPITQVLDRVRPQDGSYNYTESYDKCVLYFILKFTI